MSKPRAVSLFGQRVRDRRLDLQWTMRELADQVAKGGMRCDSAYISNLENGVHRGNVTPRTAEAFGKALRCNPAWLLGLSTDQRPAKARRAP